MKSTYAAALIITFMNAWNNYLWPKVIMNKPETQTMPMLVSNLTAGYVTDYGMLMLAVLFCTLPINYMLENYVLKEGALSWLGADFNEVNLSFLSFIIFIAVIASFVQLVEMVVEKFSPSLYASLGIFLPLIAVNCAILGGSLFMQQKEFANVGVATVYGLGSGLGWMLAIVGMAAIREKLAYSDVPKPLKGLGITFIITGLMGMAFMCFSGLKI